MSGAIGTNKYDFVIANQRQADKLRDDKADEFERLNVKIDVVDVGSFRDRQTLDEEALIKEIKDKSPTLIILTFCHSNNSELKTILANAGVLSPMFLDSERVKITPYVKEPNEAVNQ